MNNPFDPYSDPYTAGIIQDPNRPRVGTFTLDYSTQNHGPIGNLDYEVLISQNRMWASKLGWDPGKFNSEDFDATMVNNIVEFQRSLGGMKVDGICGPATYTRLRTWEVAMLTLPDSQLHDIYDEKPELAQKGIMHKGSVIEVARLPLYPVEAIGAPLTTGFGRRKDPDGIRAIVLHWDATLSARRCLSILRKREISTHFLIDNGQQNEMLAPIYQLVDTSKRAWHCGVRNDDTIGIDISNAVYIKYQEWYETHGFGPRPFVSDKVHGRNSTREKKILGMYPRQVESLQRLLLKLCEIFNIPFRFPMDTAGRPILGVFEPALKGDWKGVMCHYHLTPSKWDVAGLPIQDIFSSMAAASTASPSHPFTMKRGGYDPSLG